MNLALSEVKTEFVARIDSDDIAHPDRFAIQIDFLEKHRDCMIVGSMVDYIDDTEPLKLVNISDAITVKF